MFNSLINLYSQGDTASLATKMLQSTAWQQHNFTAYGLMQIEQLWLKNLAQFGFLSLSKQQTVAGDNFSALHLELTDDDKQLSVSLSFFFEHNQSDNNKLIKRVSCIVDTVSLAQLTNQTPEKFIATLCAGDPIQLSQFDQQLHLQSYHATPDDFIGDDSSEINEPLNHWWASWQNKNLSNLSARYHENSVINIAGLGTLENPDLLRRFQLSLFNRISRSYCQLINITIDKQQNSAAIHWQIDGDYVDGDSTTRIRIPLISLLTFDKSKIVNEQLQIDWLAICKQFNLTYPLL